MSQLGEHPQNLLADLAAALGLDGDVWLESVDTAEIEETEVHPRVLDDRFFELVRSARSQFGEALRLHLKATDVVWLESDDVTNEKRVAEFRDEIAHITGHVGVWFQLQKSEWWESIAPTAFEDSTVRWFLNADSLTRILASSLAAVEE